MKQVKKKFLCVVDTKLIFPYSFTVEIAMMNALLPNMVEVVQW